jgi:hypothetical protein
MQPMSLMAHVTVLVPDDLKTFFKDGGEAGANWALPKGKLPTELERGGHSPSYGTPTPFKIHNDLFAMMANHEYDVSGTNALHAGGSAEI